MEWFVGDPTQGAQTSDRVLAGGGAETHRFQVTLQLSTPNTYQGATTNIRSRSTPNRVSGFQIPAQ